MENKASYNAWMESKKDSYDKDKAKEKRREEEKKLKEEREKLNKHKEAEKVKHIYWKVPHAWCFISVKSLLYGCTI